MSVTPSLVASKRKDPVVLSYKALRKAVGYVAIALPFALILPYLLFHHRGKIYPHVVQGSLSAYYYTGMRNVFVGSLCAISMFMLCTRGYDKRDEFAGILSALCALGVASFPMDPTKIIEKIGCYTTPWCPPLHFVFATILFATLGYFCRKLFVITDGNPTPEKLQRNRIYKVCGWIIYLSMATEGSLALYAHKVAKTIPDWYLYGHHLLYVEIVSLWAFGYAWLIKGEAFFADKHPKPTHTITTDSLLPGRPPQAQ